MENQPNRETERALLLILREAVNSQEEFEYVHAELARCERDQCVKLGAGLGLERLEQLPVFNSHSSAAEQRPADQPFRDPKSTLMEETIMEVTS